LDGFNITIESTLSNDEQSEAGETREESAPEPVAEPDAWNCPVCTYENPISNNNCDMCATAKPEASAPLPGLISQPSIEATETYQSKDMEESELWKDLIEALKNIGLKEQPIKPEPLKEEKKEMKKEQKKSAKKEVKTVAKVEPPKPEYDFIVEVITDALSGDMNKLLYNVIRSRLGSSNNSDIIFSTEVLEIIETIHKRIKESDKYPILLPKHEFMANVGLTQEQIPNLSLEEFTQELTVLATCNPWLVWEFLALQGYDLWGNKVSYGSTKEMPTTCNLGLLEELVKLCEVDICKETKNVMKLSPTNLRFADVDKPFIKILNGYEEVRLRAKHPKLLSLGLDFIRYNWALIKTFNDNLLKAVPYINWTTCVNSIPENTIPLTLSSFLSSARSLCFNYVKICLQQAVLEQTAVPRERPPRLYFERLKLAKGEKVTYEDSKGKLTESMLYRAYEQVKEMDLTILRPTKPKGSAPFLAFEIIFKGENVVGEAGPYRQFFADVSAELQPSETSAGYTDTRSSALHLLCPTPNTKNKQGEGQDKYTLTPSSKSTADLLLYEFLGILMGCCIRTGVRLSLDLPSMIWKQIVGEPLQTIDLEAIDKSILNMIQYLTSKTLTPEVFAGTFTENFTSMLSDESTVELIKGGANIAVTYKRREEYARLLLRSRLTESMLQCRAVSKGISLVVPIALLNFLTYQEVEALVCGKPVVDIVLLKRHTRYSKGLTETSERIVLFWEVLSEFNEVDKLRFIKFCWGQERLPANDEEYERRQVRFMIKPSMRKGGNEEAALPKADTCFFNLELPNYKTKEVMRERLLLAIHTDDVSMNAEDNSTLDLISSNRLGTEEYLDY
jgi:other hect domain ubiquitin protein ligase E3